MKDLQELSKPEKRVVAKVLHNIGWGSRKIEAWLGISDSTVLRAAKELTPNELKQFEADFTEALISTKRQGVAMGVLRLLELIPRERNIDQVVKGVEYLEGKSSENVGVKKRIVATEFFGGEE